MTEKQTSEELKVCPFCGGQPKVLTSPPFVGCENDPSCVAPGGYIGETMEEAIALWNTRTPDPRMVEVLREARNRIEDLSPCHPSGECADCELISQIDALLKG